MKERIYLPIIWILIFILIGTNARISLVASSQSAEDYYKNSKAIPEVLENNINKMKKINSYGPEFVIDYITTTGNKSDVVGTLDKIQKLSDSLSSGLTDDYDKMKVFSYYVRENIYYDFDAAHNSVTFDVICLQNVLERKRTTCAGYSNLFSALCNAQGIYCINIRGAAPGDGITRQTLNSENAATNHEWVAAYYEKENRWVYVDDTWNSNNSYRNGTFKYYESTTRYFDISLELLSIEHKARIVDYRNFFEALSLYKDTTTTKPTIADEPYTSTRRTDSSSNHKQVVVDSETSEPKEKLSPKEETEGVDETNLEMASLTDNDVSEKSNQKANDSSSRLDKVESITTESSSLGNSIDEKKSNALVVSLIIIGISGVSIGGYFIFKKLK